MRILLINTNTFAKPPCIPVGLEYAAHSLETRGHSVRVCDMFPFEDPLGELDRVLSTETFDLAALSVRNLDTAQAARYVSFIPGVRMMVQNIHAAGLKTVLGGIGFSAMPVEILDYTGADYGVIGPADLVLPALCSGLADKSKEQPRIIDARGIGIDPDAVPERGAQINYHNYIKQGSVLGFATQYGCGQNCLYCTEAGAPLLMRNPRAVVAELAPLAAKGFAEYHLCDSEFNHDLGHCMEFLRQLDAAQLGIRWALYMKPLPVSAELFEMLRRTGAWLITLSVDSAEASRAGGAYSWDDVAFTVRGCRERGIKLAIDLSLGMPDEPEESCRAAIEFFRRERPDMVNVNAWYRVYGGTRLDALLRRRPDLHKFLTAPMPPGPPLEKLFFNGLPLDRVKEMAAGDSLFKLEGFDPGTNYELL